MFSDQYFHYLDKSKRFHSKSINWSGNGTWQYVLAVQQVIKQYQCQTMLDYGCGKALQYPKFAHDIGMGTYDLYDPAWPNFEVLPKKTWDLVLCLDVLPFVPESDMDTVLDLLNNLADKVCLVGLQPIVPHKTKKPFACIKSQNWWQEKISSRNKMLLIWHVANKPFVVNNPV